MVCDLCHLTKPKGVAIQDIKMCDTCACKLLDIDELDIRDFMDARRLT